MAQRTGADGRIAPRAKATGTRVFLVLVVGVALALPGCGGGSDGGASTSTSGSGSGSSSGSSSEAGSTQAPSTAASEGASLPASSGQGNDKAKQGPGITPPKGPPERGATPQEEAETTVADMSLQSPALGPAAESVQALPAEYTCDGKDSWPELKWSGIPAGTEELILFTMNVEPIDQAIFFDWAVAGIDPSLEGIEEGKLPKGVTLGRNSFGKEGYSVCPEGEGETYVFALYALPKSLSPAKGFDPMTLRKAVLDTSGNVGLLVTAYVRG